MAEPKLFQNVYLFKDMTAEEMNHINHLAQVEMFAPGDEIFNQGDKAVSLFIIRYGSIRITQEVKGEPIEISSLGSGSHFGEMSLMDGEPRSATVVTTERSEILRLDYEKLQALMAQHPVMAVKFYRSIAVFLCGRLRMTTKDLGFARERQLNLL